MNIWAFLIRSSWIVLGLLAVVLVVSFFLPQIHQYQELQRRKSVLDEEKQLQERIIVHLKRQQERLQNDPRFAERIAREEFGLVKPGETVFRFIEDDAAPDAPAP